MELQVWGEFEGQAEQWSAAEILVLLGWFSGLVTCCMVVGLGCRRRRLFSSPRCHHRAAQWRGQTKAFNARTITSLFHVQEEGQGLHLRRHGGKRTWTNDELQPIRDGAGQDLMEVPGTWNQSGDGSKVMKSNLKKVQAD